MLPLSYISSTFSLGCPQLLLVIVCTRGDEKVERELPRKADASRGFSDVIEIWYACEIEYHEIMCRNQGNAMLLRFFVGTGIPVWVSKRTDPTWTEWGMRSSCSALMWMLFNPKMKIHDEHIQHVINFLATILRFWFRIWLYELVSDTRGKIWVRINILKEYLTEYFA